MASHPLRVAGPPCRAGFLLAATLFALALPAGATTRFRAPEFFRPGNGVVLGVPVSPFDWLPTQPGYHVAAGDVDGDGFAEIACWGTDSRVHVFSCADGGWTEVFAGPPVPVSGSTPMTPVTPTVRFTNSPGAAPGAGYSRGQFLVSGYSLDHGCTIASIRRDAAGNWSQQDVFGFGFSAGGYDYRCVWEGAFSDVATGLRTGNPGTYLALPGRSAYFDPGMNLFLPDFGVSLPATGNPVYEQTIYHAIGPNGYCVPGIMAVYGSEIGAFHGPLDQSTATLTFGLLLLEPQLPPGTWLNGPCYPFDEVPATGVQLARVNLPALNRDAVVVRSAAGTLALTRWVLGSTWTTSTLPSTVSSHAGGQPLVSTSMATADLDGDGRLDIVQAFESPAGYEVLLNQGDGTFLESFVPLDAVLGPPEGLALADLDGDGTADLALVRGLPAAPDSSAPCVWIQPGRGDGTFGAPLPAPTGDLLPGSVAIADFNGDGIGDIAIGGFDTNLADGTTEKARILLNLGGTFAAPLPVLTGAFETWLPGANYLQPYPLQAGDPLSLAIAGHGFRGETSGPGDGTLNPFWVRDGVCGIDVADMNGDGVVEEVAIASPGPPVLTVEYPGSGYPTATLTLDGPRAGIRAVDWNGDGRLDVASWHYDYTSGVSEIEVLLQSSSAPLAFPDTLRYAAAAFPVLGMLPAPPFIVLPPAAGSTHRSLALLLETGAVQVICNDPAHLSRTYDVSAGLGSSPEYVPAVAADATGDGVPDLVVGMRLAAGFNQVTVLRGVPGGGDDFVPQAHYLFTGDDLAGLAVADIDQDGIPDLVTVSNDGAAPVLALGPGRATRRLAAHRAATSGSGGLRIVHGIAPLPPTTAVGGGATAPRPPLRLSLAVAPNPARRAGTTLSFALPVAGHARVALHDVAGRVVLRLADGEFAAGTHALAVPCTGEDGRALGAGVYFARVQAGGASAVSRLVVVR